MPKDQRTHNYRSSPYDSSASLNASSSSTSSVSTRRRSLAPPKNYTFAPNVTPISYPNDPSLSRSPLESNSDIDLSATELLPGEDVAAQAEASASSSSGAGASGPPAKKRRGRKDSSEHIPRPPNAFMLYRQEFVKQRHVPGSIETSHHSLSRIVGESPFIHRRYRHHRHHRIRHQTRLLCT